VCSSDLADRFLPDKAIDLIDEAASKLRMEIDSRPIALDQVERRVMQLEIEREALKKEKDAPSRERLASLEKELANLKEQATALRARWEKEKTAIQALRGLKEQTERIRLEIEHAERAADYGKAAELKYGRLAELERQAKDAEAVLADQKGDHLVKEEVDSEDVAEVVARWTGIPVSNLLEGELQKLVHMEERIHQRLVGQDEAVSAVANAIRRARAGLQDPRRPLGSFIFLGPTGVGKTELARALAEFLFDNEQAMVRLEMSEYQERHTVSRLVGAPPGYVGFEEGGQLTEAVRRKPYSVVLFDEIEKAHGDVFNLLLQILDDGRLTDGHGRTVDFKNAVIIMTSNIGSQHIAEMAPGQEDLVRTRVMEALRGQFRPEFLNRVDETILFHQLSREQLHSIVDLQLRQLQGRLQERKIAIELTAAAKELLVQEGYDPTYGARPLKRTIQRRVLDPLALKVLQGEFKEGDKIVVSAKGGEITFRRQPAAEPTTATVS
jgi:ATP-dependent Clp protease ATP-binding subunit ClpB